MQKSKIKTKGCQDISPRQLMTVQIISGSKPHHPVIIRLELGKEKHIIHKYHFKHQFCADYYAVGKNTRLTVSLSFK